MSEAARAQALSSERVALRKELAAREKELKILRQEIEKFKQERFPTYVECPGCCQEIYGYPYLEDDDCVVCQNENCDITYVYVEVISYATAGSYEDTRTHPPFSTFAPKSKVSQTDQEYYNRAIKPLTAESTTDRFKDRPVYSKNAKKWADTVLAWEE